MTISSPSAFPGPADTQADFLTQANIVHNYGSYTADDFRHVTHAWTQLANELGLTDHGLLGPLPNANIVRLIHHSTHGYGVLKVSITPAYHEGPLLSLYHQRNLPVPAIHGYGTLHPTSDHTYPWIWTSHINGTEPAPNPLHATWIIKGTRLAQQLRIPLHDNLPQNSATYPTFTMNSSNASPTRKPPSLPHYKPTITPQDTTHTRNGSKSSTTSPQTRTTSTLPTLVSSTATYAPATPYTTQTPKRSMR